MKQSLIVEQSSGSRQIARCISNNYILVMPLAGGQGGLQPTRNLGFQLTLFQPGGRGRLCPPGFENLTAALYLVYVFNKYMILGVHFNFHTQQVEFENIVSLSIICILYVKFLQISQFNAYQMRYRCIFSSLQICMHNISYLHLVLGNGLYPLGTQYLHMGPNLDFVVFLVTVVIK